MDFIYALGMIAFAIANVAAFVLILVFILKRAFAWADRRGWITYTGDVPAWGSLSNAFLEIQSIMQPQMEHVLEAKQEDEERVEEDDAGGPDSAGQDGDEAAGAGRSA